MPAADLHAPILIIGGGSAGISVAARLRRAGQMHEVKPRRLFWLMKRYALGPLYWKRMLRGRA